MSAMRAIAALGVAATAGCTSLNVDFTCKDDTSCTSDTGQAGFCEATHRCSQVDASCSTTMHRYTGYAGMRSGQCTASVDCISELRAGADTTCARTSSAVLCWGGGTAMPAPVPLPADLPAGSVAEIALGGLGMSSGGGTGPGICLRAANGDVYCGAKLDQAPAKVASLKATGLAVGANHTCAVTTGNQVACWGANASGQIGDGSTTPRPMPMPASGVANVKQVAAGFEDTCVVAMDGTVWCWGDDQEDQLGRHLFIPPFGDTPDKITSDADGSAVQAMSVTLGDHFACALRSDASVLCWGDNQHDELGDDRQLPVDTRPLPSPNSSPTPGRVHTRTATSFSQVRSGGGHSCAIDGSHQLWCWGENQLNQSTAAPSPSLQAPTLVDNGAGTPLQVDSVAVGRQHTCAFSTTRGVMCWGSNANGQIGDGTTGTAAAPTAVPLSCP